MPRVAKLQPFDKIENVRKCTGLSSTQKLILLIIASHLGKNDFCFLSFTTLQKECCIAKRTAISDNLTALIDAEIIWKIPPSKGYKSNRYGINFEKLVTDGYHCSNLRLPDRSPTVTSLVTDGYPKRNINKSEKKVKESLLSFSQQKAQAKSPSQHIEDAIKACGGKRKIKEETILQ